MAEIIIIIIAVVAVLSAGKLPNLASWIGRQRSLAKKRRGEDQGAGDQLIDITPKDRPTRSDPGPRPGTRSPGIEDAQIEEG